MGDYAQVQRAVDMIFGAVIAYRLGNRQDMRFIEGGVQRRAPVAGGAESHALGRHAGVGPAGIVAGNQFWNIHQNRPGSRLSRKRSEEHTSELQSLMRISYAVFCL